MDGASTLAEATAADGAPAGRPGGRPIAYLTGEYPRVSHTFIQREVDALRAQGVAVRTCSIRTPPASELGGPEERDAAATTFYVLDAARRPLRLLADHLALLGAAPRRYLAALALALRTAPPGVKGLLWQLFYFAEAGVLARRLRAWGARGLHNHFADSSCTVAMLAGAMAGVPFSFTMHGPTEFFAVDRWRLDEKIARAAFVACISHFCRSQLMLVSSWSDWSKLALVRCGVRPERYSAPKADVAAPGAPKLLFVGRLTAAKGVPVLLEAFSAVRASRPDATLTLVGDGPDRAALEAEARRLDLGDAARFVGYRSQAEVAAHLAEADAFVLPSFAEGVPVVLMEAMASRTPVIATRIAGIQELVEDGVSGFVIPPGDAAALAERMLRLLDDPALRARMGEAGRAKVEAEFDVDRSAAGLAALFQRHMCEAGATRR